jgi:hypothetical protein
VEGCIPQLVSSGYGFKLQWNRMLLVFYVSVLSSVHERTVSNDVGHTNDTFSA